MPIVTKAQCLLSLGVMFLISCTVKSTETEFKVVSFSGIMKNFEAGYASFDPDDRAGLHVVDRSDASNPGVLKPSGNLFDNLQLREMGETMRPIMPTFYPDRVNRVSLYTYSPYLSGSMKEGTRISFSVQADQSTPERLKQSDLMWGSLADTRISSSAPPRIELNHKLAKIVIRLSATEGASLDAPSVAITGLKSAVKLNMLDGTLGPAEGKIQPITPLRPADDGNVFQAIVVPQAVSASVALFTVTNNGKTYAYNTDTAFETGSVYEFDAAVTPDQLQVTLARR